MSDSTPSFRCLAVAVAVVFGLTWGTPIVQAACASGMDCGEAASTEVCAWGDAFAKCFSHHAHSEAVVGDILSGNGPENDTADVEDRVSTPSQSQSTQFSLEEGHVVAPASRRHVQVGVWLE